MSMDPKKNQKKEQQGQPLLAWISVALSVVLACVACVFMYMHKFKDNLTASASLNSEAIENTEDLSNLFLSLNGEAEENKKYTSAHFSQAGGSTTTNIIYHYGTIYPNAHPNLPYSMLVNNTYKDGSSIQFEKQFSPMYYLTGATITKTYMNRQMDYYFKDDASYYDVNEYELTTTTIEVETNWETHTYPDFGEYVDHRSCKHYYVSDDCGVGQGYYCTKYQTKSNWNNFFQSESWFDKQSWGDVAFGSYENASRFSSHNIEVKSVTVTTTKMDAEVYISEQLTAQKVDNYTIETKTYEEKELTDWELENELSDESRGKWVGTALNIKILEDGHPAKEFVQLSQQVNDANYTAWATIGNYLPQKDLFVQNGGLYVLKKEAAPTFCRDFLNAFAEIYRLDGLNIDSTLYANLVSQTRPVVQLSFGMAEKQFVFPEDNEFRSDYPSSLLEFFNGTYYIEYQETQTVTISNINNITLQQPEGVMLFEAFME